MVTGRGRVGRVTDWTRFICIECSIFAMHNLQICEVESELGLQNLECEGLCNCDRGASAVSIAASVSAAAATASNGPRLVVAA